MKTNILSTLLLIASLITANVALASTEIGEEQKAFAEKSKGIITISKSVVRKRMTNLVIISGARFVPMSEFLGLKGDSHLPIASADSEVTPEIAVSTD